MGVSSRELHRTDDSSRLTLIDTAQGFFRGKVLCAAVRLGIVEALADGAMTVDELAAKTATNPRALVRLLRALESIGVIAETLPARFALTPFGDPLRRDAPDSVWASMVFWADLLADAWTYLPDCVRAGDRAGAEVARRREGVTSRWSRVPDANAIFHAVFAESRADDFASLVAAWDFSHCQLIADLGGGGGGLLAAVLAAQPGARGLLVERKDAINGASKRFEALGLSARCEFIVGDLLQSVPTGADVYLMRCVLHGYDDESALSILRNVRHVMHPSCRLLLIEVVLPDAIGKPDPNIERLMMSDLNMLVVTGGQERSQNEWSTLLVSAGLQLQRVLSVAGQTACMIEAVCGD